MLKYGVAAYESSIRTGERLIRLLYVKNQDQTKWILLIAGTEGRGIIYALVWNQLLAFCLIESKTCLLESLDLSK